jgi:outer membrane protein assembly factor BamB
VAGGLCFNPAAAAEGPPVTLSNQWTLRVRSHSDCVPAIDASGVVYFGTFDGKLWAVNPDGSRRWVFETRKAGRVNLEIKSSPALGADGTVYFGCRDSRLYALTPSGRLKWTYKAKGWVDSSPAVGADGAVYFGSWDKHFYALDGEGRLMWRFASGDVVTSSPAITRGGLVVFGSHDGKVYALRESGEKAWEYVTRAQIISSPAIDTNDVVYITSVDGFFHALNSDGSARWKIKTGGVTESSPVVTQGGYIVVGANKNLWAISREGKKLWEHAATYDAYQQPIYSTPCALEDNSVIAVSGYGLLAGYDERPRMVWKYYLYGFGSGGPAVGTNGTIYISTVMPNVARCFSALSNSAPVATSTWPRFRGPLGNGRAN